MEWGGQFQLFAHKRFCSDSFLVAVSAGCLPTGESISPSQRTTNLHLLFQQFPFRYRFLSFSLIISFDFFHDLLLLLIEYYAALSLQISTWIFFLRNCIIQSVKHEMSENQMGPMKWGQNTQRKLIPSRFSSLPRV